MSDLIFHTALRSLILPGLGFLFLPLLPRQLAQWRRRVILGFLFALLLLPFWPVALHAQSPVIATTFAKETMESSLSWLAMVWLGGSVLALVRLAIQIFRLQGIVNKATFLGWLDIGGCQLKALETPAIASPCVTGWTTPLLLVPPGSSSWSDSRWQCVLWHERQHALQHDVAAIWLVRFATALYWWNPLAHLLARQFHAECEATCDAAVLNAGATPKDYVETLLSFSKMSAVPAISIAGKSSLRRRIERFLEDSKRSKTLRWRVGFGIIAAVLAMIFSLMFEVKFASPEEAQTVASPLAEEVEIRLSANPFPSTDVEADPGSAVIESR